MGDSITLQTSIHSAQYLGVLSRETGPCHLGDMLVGDGQESHTLSCPEGDQCGGKKQNKAEKKQNSSWRANQGTGLLERSLGPHPCSRGTGPLPSSFYGPRAADTGAKRDLPRTGAHLEFHRPVSITFLQIAGPSPSVVVTFLLPADDRRPDLYPVGRFGFFLYCLGQISTNSCHLHNCSDLFPGKQLYFLCKRKIWS